MKYWMIYSTEKISKFFFLKFYLFNTIVMSLILFTINQQKECPSNNENDRKKAMQYKK